MSKSKAPNCCGEPSAWVDYGPRLQYFYCKKCKKEVEQTKDKDWDDPAPWGFNENTLNVLRSHYITSSGGTTNPAKHIIEPLDLKTEVSSISTNKCGMVIHAWTSQASYDAYDVCECGTRFKPASTPLIPIKFVGGLGHAGIPTKPIKLLSTEKGHFGASPCTGGIGGEHYFYISNTTGRYVCNCGERFC